MKLDKFTRNSIISPFWAYDVAKAWAIRGEGILWSMKASAVNGVGGLYSMHSDHLYTLIKMNTEKHYEVLAAALETPCDVCCNTFCDNANNLSAVTIFNFWFLGDFRIPVNC